MLGIASFSAYLLHPWAWVQFTHNPMAALVTGSFVVSVSQEGARMKAVVGIQGLLEEVRVGFGTAGTVWKAQSPVCREPRRGRA